MTAEQCARLALLAVLSDALPALAVGTPPHRIVWGGTISMTDGVTGTLVVRTHLIKPGRVHAVAAAYAEYGGRFRCRGPGCPAHRGTSHLIIGLTPDSLAGTVFLDAHVGSAVLRCASIFNGSASLPLSGADQCYESTGHRAPGNLVAEGTVTLEPSPTPWTDVRR